MNRSLHHAATALVLLFAALAVVGAVHTGLFLQSVWQPDLRTHMAGFVPIALGVIALVALARRRGWSRGMLAVGATTAAALVFAGPGPVVTVALALVSAFCLGQRVLPDAVFDEPVAIALAATLGLAGLSLVVGVLSFFPVASSGTYLLVMALPIAWGFARSRERLARAWGAVRARETTRSPAADALSTAIGIALAMQALAVLQPEFGYDTLHMHLSIVDQLRAHGRAEYDVGHFAWAVMPMGADWLFALVNLPGGDASARLLNFCAEGLLLALLHGYVSPRAGRLPALLAVAMFVLMPLAYLEVSTLFVETIWALWIVASIACAARSLDDADPRWVFASALLFGAAMGAKVIAVFAAPFLLATAVAWVVRKRLALLRDLGLATLGIVAFGALPYVNAWVRTGNPVFPFFNHLFRSPQFGTQGFDNPLYHQPMDWRALYDLTFRSSGYLEAPNGAIGVLWLVLLPAAALLAWRSGRRHAAAGVLALVFIAGVFSSQTYLRYIQPMFAVLAVVVAVALGEWSRGKFERWLLGGVVAAGSVVALLVYTSASWDYRKLRLPPEPDAQARREFARDRMDSRLVPAILDSLDLRRALWLGPPRIAGSNARVELANWVAPANQASLAAAVATVEQTRAWVAARDFEAIVIAEDAEPCPVQPGLCAFLARDAVKIYDTGRIAVYRVRDEVLFDRELLVNTDFRAGRANWEGEGVIDAAAGRARVDANTPLIQRVPVRAGDKYRLELDARCTPEAPDAYLRPQVTWLTADEDVIGSPSLAIPCSRARPARMTMPAPAGAAEVIVYVSGHFPGQPVEVDRVSFRQ